MPTTGRALADAGGATMPTTGRALAHVRRTLQHLSALPARTGNASSHGKTTLPRTGNASSHGKTALPRTGNASSHGETTEGIEVRGPDGDGVAVLSMQSEPVNTLTAEFIEGITHTFQVLEQDPQAKGVVLTSGLRAFCAGLDLNAISPAPAQADFKVFWQAFEEMYKTILLSPLATVCAINGSAPAGGTLLAMCCDYRVIADVDRLSMGLNETAVGIVPPAWVRALAARTLGERQAELHLQNALMVNPSAALSAGFVDAVVSQDDLLQTCIAQAAAMAAIPAEARASTKKAQRDGIATLMGPKSVAEMWACVESASFQQQAQDVLASMSKKK